MSEIENKELTPEKESGLNFVEQMVADDLKKLKDKGVSTIHLKNLFIML